MKSLHIISSLDITKGGPSKSVPDLCLQLNNLNVGVTIISQKSPSSYLNELNMQNIKLNFVKIGSFKHVMQNVLRNEKFDLLHGHGLWHLPVHQMSKLALKLNLPYIISPRGMLEPWALAQRKTKKKIALICFQQKDLAKADCIHATAMSEAENIRKLEFKNPIAVIPNGIDLSEYPLKKGNDSNIIRTILFLSRIHQKKGIEILIESWGSIHKSLRSNWKIKIVGNGDPLYVNGLKKLIISKNFENEIEIIGPKFGEDKINTFHQADLFVLPTYSENFGIVIAEALACGLPVITTKGTPWEDLNTFKAGWWIDIGAESLKIALIEAMRLSENELQKRGLNGRKLIEEKYTIQSTAKKMVGLYEWILNGGETPDFVLK